MSLVFKLARKNLFHDRLRFIATIIGVVFSIVLVTVQMGLFLSFDRTVTTMIDHADADLWIVPRGTKSFEDPSLIDERERFRALSVEGVREATPVAIGFAQWRMRTGNTTPVFIIASDVRSNGLHPWNLVAGNLDDLSIPGGVAIDRSYFNRLGSKGLGDTAEIRDQKAEVTAVTSGIRSFTTTPYVFTTLDRGRDYVGMMPSKATYFLVHLTPGANAEVVSRRLNAALTDADVLTP
jgi:putative ABC transport system permease protein